RIRASRRSYRNRRACGCGVGAAQAANPASRESTWAGRSTPHSRLAVLLQEPARVRVRCRSGASREPGEPGIDVGGPIDAAFGPRGAPTGTGARAGAV